MSTQKPFEEKKECSLCGLFSVHYVLDIYGIMHENGIEEMSAFHFSNTLTSSWRHQNSGAWNLFVTFFFMTNFQLNFLTLGLSSGEVPSQAMADFFMTNFQLNFLTLGLTSGEVPSQAMAESGERREQTDFLARERDKRRREQQSHTNKVSHEC